MEGYFFKLVCIDDTNPIEYCVLEDVNVATLEDVHNFVVKNIYNHTPENSKWLLMPMRMQQTSGACTG